MTVDIDTPYGPARAHLQASEGATTALVLGHGAGGGVNAPDLVAAKRAALALGASVVLVEQPYRVAGRRSPAPTPQLDAAWLSVIEQLDLDELDAVTVPVLVMQGARDPFGMPPPAPNRTVVEVDGDHSLRAGAKAVEAAVGEWLSARGARASARAPR